MPNDYCPLQVHRIYRWGNEEFFVKVLTEPELDCDPESRFYKEYTFLGRDIITGVESYMTAHGAWREA